MDHDFVDKTVLITGAAGDIGRSLCQRFLALQANVYQTDIRETAAPNFTSGDVSDPDFVKVWINSILSQTDRIDVLLNVAGICPRTPLANVEAEEWDQVLRVNLRSTFLLSQMAIASMITQKSGAIINFASLAGQVGGIAVGAHYSASKAAIGALTKSLARTGAPHGVRVNAVAPGIIDTSMTTDAGPEKVDQLIQSIPMARLGGIDEVVQPIVFLASSQASYITGTTLDINGGIYMN